MKPSVFRERMAGASIAYRDCADLCERLATSTSAFDKSSDIYTARELEVSEKSVRAAFAMLAEAFRDKAGNVSAVPSPDHARPH